jgi:hypothetical protein
MEAQLGPVSSPDGFLGEESSIEATCFSVSNPSSAFVTAETWLANQGSSNYWIEAGLAYGAPVGARSYFYYADDRPGYGYYEHDDTSDSVTLGTIYAVNIDQQTATSFHVSAGPFSGLSSSWPSGYLFNVLQTGSETYAGGTAATILASSRYLHFYNQSNSILADWYYGSDSTYTWTQPTTWGTITQITANWQYRYNTVTSC